VTALCSCDKQRYPTRKAAKRVARRRHPGEALRVYPCPAVPGLFHVGHLSRDVIAGRVGRDVYGGTA